MARNGCTVCRHPQAAAINAGLAKPGVSQREIAVSFGLNQKTLWRHATLCVARSVSKAVEKQELISGVSMIGDISRVRGMYDSAMSQTYQSGDFKTLAPLGTVYLKATEQIAKLAGLDGFKQPQTILNQVSVDARGSQFALVMPFHPALQAAETKELAPPSDPNVIDI